VLPANASSSPKQLRISRLFVRYRERCEQGCSHDCRQDGGGTKIKSTADFQSAVALCFQPTLLQARNNFGFRDCSSAIANGVSKDAHTTAAKMGGGTSELKVPLTSSRRSRRASSQRFFKPESTLDFENIRPLSRTAVQTVKTNRHIFL
jgi:hypothetical protein